MLIDVPAFRERFQLRDVDAINAAAMSAVEAATIHIESWLDTDFDRDVFVDYFDISFARRKFPKSKPLLRLSRGFVLSGEPFAVKVAPTMDELADAEEVSGSIDWERGLALLLGFDFDLDSNHPEQLFARVGYTAGFEKSGAVYADTPSWLREVAMLQAARLYADAMRDKEIAKHADPKSVMQRHLRKHPDSIAALVR